MVGAAIWRAGLSADRSAPTHLVDVDLSNVTRAAGSGSNYVPAGNPTTVEIDFSANPHLISGGGVWLHLQAIRHGHGKF